jgi:hypothetical protein
MIYELVDAVKKDLVQSGLKVNEINFKDLLTLNQGSLNIRTPAVNLVIGETKNVGRVNKDPRNRRAKRKV